VCISIFIFTHVRMCTCIYIYTHGYIHRYIHTYINYYIHTHIHTYIHTYIHAHIHTCTYIHICMYVLIVYAHVHWIFIHHRWQNILTTTFSFGLLHAGYTVIQNFIRIDIKKGTMRPFWMAPISTVTLLSGTLQK
jgi:hypothetical protein